MDNNSRAAAAVQQGDQNLKTLAGQTLREECIPVQKFHFTKIVKGLKNCPIYIFK